MCPRSVALLHNATLAVIPLPFRLFGARGIGESVAQWSAFPEVRGRFRLITTKANGLPALAADRRGDAASRRWSCTSSRQPATASVRRLRISIRASSGASLCRGYPLRRFAADKYAER
jgi:hypothetical protein